MALHGDIKVNGRVIHSWSALRLDDPPSAVNRYHWAVYGRRLVDDVEGELEHVYDDGATVLAEKVLQAYRGHRG